MRRYVSALAAAAAGCFALTGLPYVCYLVVYALVRPTGVAADVEDVSDSALPRVSVVVPTYNEERIVEAKLRDIVGLDYPMEKVEVVLADASDDETVAVARDFFADRSAPTLTVRRDDERRGVAHAVNDAVAAASGDLILRTDADSALDPGVLRAAVATLEDESVGAVTGRQTEVLGDSQVESDYRDLLSIVQAVESWVDSTFIVHGPCTVFRRDLYEPVPTDTIADDTAFALRIRRAGYRIVMNPEMAFVESGVSGFTKRRTRKDRRAMGLLQLLHRNRDMLGGYGGFGWVVLPANWWFMVLSPWLFAGGVALATALGLLVAGPLGFVVPLSAAAFVYLGGRDALGPLQAPYAVVDSMVSLLVASVRLRTEEGDGTWTVDRASREAFES